MMIAFCNNKNVEMVAGKEGYVGGSLKVALVIEKMK